MAETLYLQDTDTEAAILGILLLEHGAGADIIMEQLSEADFTGTENRIIFEAIRDMFLAGQTDFNEITVDQKLKEKGQSQTVGGKIRLTNLQAKAPYPLPEKDDIQGYVDILKEKTMRRSMYEAGAALQKAAHAPEVKPLDGISLAEHSLMDISTQGDRKAADTPAVMDEAFSYLVDMYNSKPPEGAITTGIHGLDEILTSINPTDFMIIGARPAMGKTAFAANILENVALKQGKYVCLYSLEMSSAQIGARMLLSQSGISSERLRQGNLSSTDMMILEDTRDKLKTAPLFIDDRVPLDISTIISRSRKLKAEKNLGLIIIDYLQLMTGARGNDGRQQEVSDISRSLKMLAKELKIPVIALSQLNRSLEARNDKRPQMSDLRESGSLEQDADIVVFLYRDDYYHPDTQEQGVTEAIVAKHRNGPIGTVKMLFNKDTTHFCDLDRRGEDAPPQPVIQKSMFPEKKEEQADEPPTAPEEAGPPTANMPTEPDFTSGDSFAELANEDGVIDL